MALGQEVAPLDVAAPGCALVVWLRLLGCLTVVEVRAACEESVCTMGRE